MHGRTRTYRTRLFGGAAIALVGLAGPLAVSGGASPAVSRVPAPTPNQPAGPVLLGVVGGQLPVTTTTRLDTFQAKAGRSMATVRMYGLWDSAFPDPLSSYAKAHGQTVVLSVKAKTRAGTIVPWASIANAKPGDPAYAQIQRWAQAVKAFDAPVFFTFNHEPEAAASDRNGTAADFVAAWRNVVKVFQGEGVRNAEYTFIATAFGWKRTDRRSAVRYYPGDDVVDDIGVDGYNWFTCRPTVKNAWQSAQSLLEPVRQFALQHPQKGVVVGELGSVEDPKVSGRKAQWYADAQAMLKQPGYGQFRAVAEWYKVGDPGTCNWAIDTSASSQAAFQAWGADPQDAAMSVAPSTVRQVTAVATDASTAQVTWAAAGAGGSPVTSYTVSVAETGETFMVDGSQSSYTYSPELVLSPGGSYTFSVSATNTTGSSRPAAAPSAVALTPQPPLG